MRNIRPEGITETVASLLPTEIDGPVIRRTLAPYMHSLQIGYQGVYNFPPRDEEMTVLNVAGTAFVLFQRSEWDGFGMSNLRAGDTFTCPPGYQLTLSNVGDGPLVLIVASTLTLGGRHGEPSGPREAGAEEGIRQGQELCEQEAGGHEGMAAAGAAASGPDRHPAPPEDDQASWAVPND